LLKKTSEHGIIQMSIKNLWQKIALKNTSDTSGAKKEMYFIWHKVPQRIESQPGEDIVFSQEQCIE